MKRLLALLLPIALLCAQSCHGDDDFDALPRSISTFVCQYWPDPDIESYTRPSPDVYVVIIHNGPKLTFGAGYAWTDIDGCGLPLPQVLLYNELPGPLYRYLAETEATGAVFRITRTPRLYTIVLLDGTLTYDPSTHAIHSMTL